MKVLIPVIVVVCVGVLGACRKQRLELLADASPPPSFSKASKPLAEFESDVLWKAATQGDPLHLAALADREGADGLLVGLEAGGSVGTTALRALAYAPDAQLALRRLSEIVLQLDGDSQRDVLGIIESIALRPVEHEVADADVFQACSTALKDIALNGRISSALRAKAVSILRLLIDQHRIQPLAVPTDFDEK